ncbi:MAG: hypothetical protein IPJ61_03025 [Tessaracoccus sp.]|uniref:ABC transporter permease subunit n=1 Tax=Tessaracoccus sp. TaxID=1971211 RepID=UPI001EBACD34|nr:ABC transporter permease subunit [Tessaracoccus sp.]MBK7820059.1 hypothetical protein [Tessaracoccus sp.]
MLGNLLRAEFSRLLYRRRATYSIVLMLAVGLLAPTQWMPEIGPLSAEDHAFAREQYVACLEWEDIPGACVYEDFLRSPWGFPDVVSSLASSVLLFAFIVFLIVVTYVGSDFASGALGTQLTFTPRRWAVVLSRTLAAGVLGAVLMAVGLLAATVESVVWYMAMFGFNAATPAVGLLGVIGASITYGALLGAIGALLVFLLNGTVLAIAAGLLAVTATGWGAMIMGDGSANLWYYFGPVWQGLTLVQPELVSGDVSAVLPVQRLTGLAYHLVVIAVLAALAVPLFERRDVKG